MEPADGVYTLPVRVWDGTADGPLSAVAGAFTVCFPTLTTAQQTTPTGDVITKKCKNSANTINLDLRGIETVEPTLSPTPDASTFYPSINFALLDDSLRSSQVYELRNITATLDLGDGNPINLFGSGGSYLPEGSSTSFAANILGKKTSATERKLKVNFTGDVWDITDTTAPKNTTKQCKLDPSNSKAVITVPATQSLSAPIAYYGLRLQYSTSVVTNPPTGCQLSENQTFFDQSVIGDSNEAFNLAMTKWTNGEIGVLQMSAFISQLTRAPGLQITTCDPESGGCDF